MECSNTHIPGVLFQIFRFDRSGVGHSGTHLTSSQDDSDGGDL